MLLSKKVTTGHRLARVRACAHTSDRGRPRSIPMPGGVWLNPKDHNYQILYGSTFVIQRDRVGGPGLVLANRDWDMIQVWAPSTPTDLVAWDQPGQLQCLDAAILDVDYVDISSTSKDAASDPEDCGSACTSLVYAGPFQSSHTSDMETSLNPRRTRKMQFTCNRCGTRNTNSVNPHAWKNGAVFCRCDGCGIVHLIRDEKNILGRAKPTPQDTSLKIPDGLAQFPEVPGGAVGGEEIL